MLWRNCGGSNLINFDIISLIGKEFLQRFTLATLLALPLTACGNDGSTETASQPRSGAETRVLPNTKEITIGQTHYLLDEQLASSAEFVSLLQTAHAKLVTIWGTEPQNDKGEAGLIAKLSRLQYKQRQNSK